MSVTETIRSIPLTATEGKRKRSEVRRYYYHNLENIEDGEIEIIPYHDPRLNHLSSWGQDIVVEINTIARTEGEHVEGNRYVLDDEEAICEIEDKIQSLFVNIDSSNSTHDMLRVFAVVMILILVILVSGELSYLVELVSEIRPN